MGLSYKRAGDYIILEISLKKASHLSYNRLKYMSMRFMSQYL